MTILDFAMMTSNTTGNGSVAQLIASVSGYQSFSSAGAVNNTIYSYGIKDVSSTWELGQGTYITNSAGQFMLRTTVNYSSNTNNQIGLSGAAVIYSNFLQHDYDTFTPGNSIAIGANLTINATTFNVGNSVANLTSNSSEILLTNATANTFIVPGQELVGNSTANVGIFGLLAQTSLQNSSANTFITPGSINIGNSVANLTANNAELLYSNSTANTIITPGGITLAGSGSNTNLILGTSSLAANGYTWLPNGLLLQWLKVTANSSTTPNVATLPIAFPTGIFGAFGSVANLSTILPVNILLTNTSTISVGCNTALAVAPSISVIVIGH